MISIYSAAFQEGEFIPRKYTCDGENISPPISWEGISSQAKSLALLVEDIDSVAGTWSHWLVYNLPPSQTGLQEGLSAEEVLSEGLYQGKNDFEEIGYGGPCPSDGKPHRYQIRLLALKEAPGLPAGVTRERFLEEAHSKIIQEGNLMGKYQLRKDRNQSRKEEER